jgi:hypothetical protein
VIHRNIRITQNIFRYIVIFVAERDSDAEARENLSAV